MWDEGNGWFEHDDFSKYIINPTPHPDPDSVIGDYVKWRLLGDREDA